MATRRFRFCSLLVVLLVSVPVALAQTHTLSPSSLTARFQEEPHAFQVIRSDLSGGVLLQQDRMSFEVKGVRYEVVEVPQYGLFEEAFRQTGSYENPYLQVDYATAALTGPDGRTLRLPLFWDGSTTWKFRFSPPTLGEWHWTVESNDAGLDGVSGTFRVVPSNRSGGIQAMPDFRHHFQRQDGTPFWWMGDTAWALFTTNQKEHHDRAAVKHYIDVRARQGFNVIHAMLLSEAGWGNEGGKPFTSLSAQRIHSAYWQEVDRRLSYLNRHGITGGLVLAWGDKGENPMNWHDFPSQQARERYARYIVARYSAYDVYFIVAGEWNSRGSDSSRRAMFNAIGKALDAADPHERMIAIHPYGNASVMRFADEPWISFGDYQQIYHDLHQHILDARKHEPAKPVVQAEYAYFLRDRDGDGDVDKPNSTTLQDIRHATWDIVMAGGYVVTGFGTTYFGGYRDPGPFDVDAAKNNPWEQDVQHIKELFTGLQWWKLSPADPLVHADHQGGDEHAHWALAEIGRQYVLYTRGDTDVLELSLGNAPPERYTLRQFNPRTGEYTRLTSYEGDGPITYTPPNAQDWVLVVEAAPASAQEHIIESVMEDIDEAEDTETGEGCEEGQYNREVTSPVRAGQIAFKHYVEDCGERAEFAMMDTEIGSEYWYGWSMYVPEDFDERERDTIVMQLATWPSPRDGEFPCGGNGHKIEISSSGQFEYDLQHKSESKDAVCDTYPLGRLENIRGKWVDFVMHAKWTGDTDGFLKLWMKVGKEGDYEQKIDYEGRTWWNDEEDGPYFKMGVYTGEEGWPGPPSRTIYTDAYRLGDAGAGFEAVAPGSH